MLPSHNSIVDIARSTSRERILIAAYRKSMNANEDDQNQLKALLDAIAVLESLPIRYALIGGLAVGIHSGVPRATLDVDIAILSTSCFEQIIERMLSNGFQFIGKHPHSINFRHVSGEPVQLAFDVEFDSMLERSVDFTVFEKIIRIVRKEDLISMKRRAALDPTRRRSKALRDEADIELLLGDVPEPDEGW